MKPLKALHIRAREYERDGMLQFDKLPTPPLPREVLLVILQEGMWMGAQPPPHRLPQAKSWAQLADRGRECLRMPKRRGKFSSKYTKVAAVRSVDSVIAGQHVQQLYLQPETRGPTSPPQTTVAGRGPQSDSASRAAASSRLNQCCDSIKVARAPARVCVRTAASMTVHVCTGNIQNSLRAQTTTRLDYQIVLIVDMRTCTPTFILLS